MSILKIPPCKTTEKLDKQEVKEENLRERVKHSPLCNLLAPYREVLDLDKKDLTSEAS